jgi:hypothetical protein
LVPSTPGWLATWPTPPPSTPKPPGASPSPTAAATPSVTAVPDPHQKTPEHLARNSRNRVRRPVRILPEASSPGPAAQPHPQHQTPGAPTDPASPSPPLTSMARRAATGPGGCPPASQDNETWYSPSARSPPTSAITGTRLPATTPASCSATSPRSGTPHVPPRPAEDQPPAAISNTTSHSRRVAERVCVTAVRSAGITIGSSRTRAGRSSNPPRRSSAGGRPPAAFTAPSPRATRPEKGGQGTRARLPSTVQTVKKSVKMPGQIGSSGNSCGQAHD